MKLRKKIRRIPESILLCMGFLVVPFIPRRGIVWLAGLLGRAGLTLSTRSRRVALANLDAAYGDGLTQEEKLRIAREAFRTFCLVTLDYFWFAFFTRQRIRAHVRFDATFERYRETRPGISVTAHLGNWEVMGLAAALDGPPAVSVAASIKNPLADLFLSRVRRITGQGIEARRGAVRRIIGVLRNGGRAAFLMDQNTLPSEGGVFVDFFGLAVPVSNAVALLARRTGTAIVMPYCLVDGAGEYTIHVSTVFHAETGSHADALTTQRITHEIETLVRRYPGQWLWIYKRWKFLPPDGDRHGYPYYSRTDPGVNKKRFMADRAGALSKTD